MKSKILVLLSVVIYFSSCTKDALSPIANQSLTSQNQLSKPGAQGSTTQSTIEYMSIQLFEDAVNTDKTMIVFIIKYFNIFFEKKMIKFFLSTSFF